MLNAKSSRGSISATILFSDFAHLFLSKQHPGICNALRPLQLLQGTFTFQNSSIFVKCPGGEGGGVHQISEHKIVKFDTLPDSTFPQPKIYNVLLQGKKSMPFHCKYAFSNILFFTKTQQAIENTLGQKITYSIRSKSVGLKLALLQRQWLCYFGQNALGQNKANFLRLFGLTSMIQKNCLFSKHFGLKVHVALKLLVS